MKIKKFQHLMKAIKNEQPLELITRREEDQQIIEDLAETLKRPDQDGRFYQGVGVFEGLICTFPGKDLEPTAKSPNNLTPDGIYQVKDKDLNSENNERVRKSQQVPVFEVRIRSSGQTEISYLTIVNGNLKVDGLFPLSRLRNKVKNKRR